MRSTFMSGELHRPRRQSTPSPGDWLSRFPQSLGIEAGEAPTFEDPRLEWAIPRVRVDRARVLELGPLEGGHSYMLEQAGASSVLAIESNRNAFARCLVTAHLTGLERSRFECGDFVEFLRGCEETFDVCVACGVLYHLVDPVELISLLSTRAKRLFLRTHHFDESISGSSRRFQSPLDSECDGFRHRLHPRPYSRIGLRFASFPGGTNRTASWLSRHDLMGSLEHFGWD